MWEVETGWIWTIVELNLAIIAASAPALKPFFEQCLIRPTTNLCQRVRTPGYSTFSEKDGIWMRHGLFGCIGERDSESEKEKEEAGDEEIGSLLTLKPGTPQDERIV